MLEFNTDEDLHTIMKYTRQVERERGYVGVIFVNIERLAQIHEQKCKIVTMLYMRSIGLPVTN